MSDPSTAVVVNTVACVAFVAVGLLSWRGRVGRPVTAVALTCVAACGLWWSLAAAVGSALPGDAGAWASLAAYPAIGGTVASFVVLAYAVGHPDWTPSRPLLLALAVEPVVIGTAALTNPWHGLVYRWMTDGHLFPAGSTAGPSDHNLHGTLFWAHTGYSYLLLLTGVAVLFVGWRRSPRVFALQRLLILLGSLPPIALNALHVSNLVTFPIQPTTAAFALTGMIMAYALLRQDLLVLAPVAREVIVDRVADAIIAVGPDGRILDLNPAAVDLVAAADGPGAVPVGRPVSQILGGALAGTATDDAEQLTLRFGEDPCDLHVRRSELVDRRGRELGVVVVLRDVTELNRQRHELALANARLTAQVETIDRLRRDLAEQASRDVLTGLHNRRHVSAHLGALVEASVRADRPLGLLMIDVDHFKGINDRYGHAVGDAVLVALAETLVGPAPSDALVARWGGEEFLMVLPGADVGRATEVADGLCRRMRALRIPVGDGDVTCTVSIGVVSGRGPGTDVDDLLAGADVALYAAKAGGRDRVVVGSADLVTGPRPG